MLELLHTPHLWRQVQAVRGQGPVVAAVAYATEDHLGMKAGDILICDASDERIAAGATSHALLSALAARRVQLFHLDKLHAKVVRTSSHAVVGSANMTARSRDLVEAAVLTDDASALRQVDAMLQGLLRSKQIRRIDARFLKHIAGIEVIAGGGGPRRPRQPLVPKEREALAWLMGFSYHTERQHARAVQSITSATGQSEVPPFVESTVKEATRYGRIQPGDTLYLVDRQELRVRPALVVTGVLPVDEQVFHFHKGIEERGVAWARVLAKLKEIGAYGGAGIPRRLALSADAAAVVNGMFRSTRK